MYQPQPAQSDPLEGILGDIVGAVGDVASAALSLSPSQAIMRATGLDALSPSAQASGAIQRIAHGENVGTVLSETLRNQSPTEIIRRLGDSPLGRSLSGGQSPMGGAELIALSQAASQAADTARRSGADDHAMREMGRVVVQNLTASIGPHVNAINSALGLAATQRQATDEHLRLADANAKFRTVVGKLDTLLARIPRQAVEEQVVRVYFGG